MINVLFNTQDEEDWVRISPTGSSQIYNCNFFFQQGRFSKKNKNRFFSCF